MESEFFSFTHSFEMTSGNVLIVNVRGSKEALMIDRIKKLNVLKNLYPHNNKEVYFFSFQKLMKVLFQPNLETLCCLTFLQKTFAIKNMWNMLLSI